MNLLSQEALIYWLIYIASLAILKVHEQSKFNRLQENTYIRVHQLFEQMPNVIMDKDSVKFIGKISYSNEEMDKMFFRK